MAAEDFAAEVRRITGEGFTVNQIQQAFYNGHYKKHGAKIQHVILANGIVHAFPFSIREHDSRGYYKSPIEWQMQCLKHTDGSPLKLGTDQAYAESESLVPVIGRRTLNAMSPTNRDAALARNEAIKLYRLQSENSFDKQIRLFPHADDHTKHRLFHDGQMDWDGATSAWMIQTLFCNIHTCLYGSQVTGCFKINPPTVAEYLENCNRGYIYTYIASMNVA